MSDWINALRQACENTSQSRVAKRLGVSGAMISQALNNKYPIGRAHV